MAALAAVWTLLLLATACADGRPHGGGGGARKIRHDHQSQDEQPDAAGFEFETTRGGLLLPQRSDDGDYDDDDGGGGGTTEDVALDVSHRLFDASKGIVPNIVYQVRINCSTAVTTLYNYTIVVNGKLLARGQPAVADCGDLPAVDWSATTADQQSHKYATFRLEYCMIGIPEINQYKKRIPILKGCTMHAKSNSESGRLTWRDLPPPAATSNPPGRSTTCTFFLPPITSATRLVVDLVKLNVPCSRGGRVQVSGYRPVCGKMEDLSSAERRYVFDSNGTSTSPSLVVVTKTDYSWNAFTVSYAMKSACYDRTISSHNGSITFLANVQCRYTIAQPFGYRIWLLISSEPWGYSSSLHPYYASSDTSTDATAITAVLRPTPATGPSSPCSGTLFRLTDGTAVWTHCATAEDGPGRRMSLVSRTNTVVLETSVAAAWKSAAASSIIVAYRSVPVTAVVGSCPYGSVSLNSPTSPRCLTVINAPMTWTDAERHCATRHAGGHLASVDSPRTQALIDTMLMNSQTDNDNLAAYWIGATDMNNEGFFKWTDSSPFTYSNWYQGHVHQPYGGPNSKQPNDDGLSRQDCVELRQVYRPQNRLFEYYNRNSSYTWNDRDCSVKNRFLCQIQQSTSPGDYDPDEPNCNSTIRLTSEMKFAAVSSPGFPQPYSDNQDCTISVEAPRGYQIEVEFEELMLEDESTCSYDYVELIPGDDDQGPKHCGDKSDVLKLTRFVTVEPKLRIHFVSDYSHTFSGFKARVSAELVNNGCDDARQQIFNGSCYLFASYPEVSWHTARSVCNGIKAELASIHNAEEEQFVESLIRESTDSRSAIYWLGGTWDDKSWHWVDNSTETFSAWVATDPINVLSYRNMCMAISWLSSPPVHLPRGLYWTANMCDTIGGYICKKNQINFSDYYNLNTTMVGAEGVITSLNYPANYYHNLDYWIHVRGPNQSRVVFQFDSINVEPQADCLYDYVSVVELPAPGAGGPGNRTMTVCGYRGNDLEDYVFVTDANEAYVHFHSDYSVSSSGFHLTWNVIDMSGCSSQSLTASEGNVVSPNYPKFILPSLNCIIVIMAPVGQRIWIDFVDYDLDDQQSIKLYLSKKPNEYTTPFKYRNSVNDGAFLSDGESVKIEYSTNRAPRGRGFKIAYKLVMEFEEERAILLRNDSSGFMYRLNYPLPMHFPKLRYKQRLMAPIGRNIQLQFNHVIPAQMDTALGRTVCAGQQSTTAIEVHDHYAARNGTWWLLCENVDHLKSVPIIITSYLNAVSVVTVYGQTPAVDMASVNVSVNVKPDAESKKKLIAMAKVLDTKSTNKTHVESCKPDPCVNGGICVLRKATKTHYCKCQGNYTGTFCSLTYCDLGYCVFGECLLAGGKGFECKCQYGYTGRFCDEKIKPCELNPCKDHGDCVSLGDSGYQCRCYAYWTGDQCERKMLHITYKPLTERMLQEPFWLGLLTVFVVMGILGIIWCAKRHVPEKIEKILSEEAERSRHFTVNASGRMSSMRGELLVPTVKTNGATPSEGGNSPPPQPKTFLSRLGFGQHRSKQKSCASPSKCRTTIADKSEILQQLISPGLERQASFNDEINLVDKLSTNNIGPNDIVLPQSNVSQETSFSNDCSIDEAVQKIEKKVTFARLMNKFQSEMSSTSSEVDARTKRNLKRPGANQGSDSLSSLDYATDNRKPTHLSLDQYPQQTGQKAMSADSILAMFRSFNATAAMTEMGNYLSASTTPSCSSLQDEVVGSEDDSFVSNAAAAAAAAAHSSGGKESPTRYRYSNVIQLPVVDMLSSQRNNSNNPLNSLQHPPSILLEVPNYRLDCLSPIHELPTPMPSPSPTPVATRKSAFGCLKDGAAVRPPDDAADERDGAGRNQAADRVGLTIPAVVVQQPTPVSSPSAERPGSPPPHKERPSWPGDVPGGGGNRMMLRDMTDKPASVDLPAPPPVITVTCTSDSDTEYSAPARTGGGGGGADSFGNGVGNGGGGGGGGGAGGMCYLSPFSMCSRADRIASESNLSSSGYSSAGPSRCNSNARLCPSEELAPPPTRAAAGPTDAAAMRDSEETTYSDDDDVDEGFDTETADASVGPLAVPSITVQQYHSRGGRLHPSTLQLPGDPLQPDATAALEKSPVSSRSESPLSDKTVFRFSPMYFRGRAVACSTDSEDGAYDDATSSECCGGTAGRRATVTGCRRRKRRRSLHQPHPPSAVGPSCCASPPFVEPPLPPTPPSLLDVPGRCEREKSARSKPNARRRSRSRQTVVPSSSSSSSAESLNDAKTSYGNRHKRSSDSVKRNPSAENWSDRAKSGEDKKTCRRKTKSDRDENRQLNVHHKTVSDQGLYESEVGEDVPNFVSLPSLRPTVDGGLVAVAPETDEIAPARTDGIRKRVTASD